MEHEEYNYKLNCGQYVLHLGEKPIGPVMDEVAIAFSLETGTLHKHGNPEMVNQWMTKSVEMFRAAGFDDVANDLTMISGRFELEDLNRCLSTSGFAKRLYLKITQNIERIRARP